MVPISANENELVHHSTEDLKNDSTEILSIVATGLVE